MALIQTASEKNLNPLTVNLIRSKKTGVNLKKSILISLVALAAVRIIYQYQSSSKIIRYSFLKGEQGGFSGRAYQTVDRLIFLSSIIACKILFSKTESKAAKTLLCIVAIAAIRELYQDAVSRKSNKSVLDLRKALAISEDLKKIPLNGYSEESINSKKSSVCYGVRDFSEPSGDEFQKEKQLLANLKDCSDFFETMQEHFISAVEETLEFYDFEKVQESERDPQVQDKIHHIFTLIFSNETYPNFHSRPSGFYTQICKLSYILDEVYLNAPLKIKKQYAQALVALLVKHNTPFYQYNVGTLLLCLREYAREEVIGAVLTKKLELPILLKTDLAPITIYDNLPYDKVGHSSSEKDTIKDALKRQALVPLEKLLRDFRVLSAEEVGLKLEKNSKKAFEYAPEPSVKAGRASQITPSFLEEAQKERIAGLLTLYGVCRPIKDAEERYESDKDKYTAVKRAGNVLGMFWGEAHCTGIRPSMEDHYNVQTLCIDLKGKSYHLPIFSIFDGHGGDFISKKASLELASKIQEHLISQITNQQTIEDYHVVEALKHAFVDFQYDLQREFERGEANKKFRGGSTALVVIEVFGKYFTACLGDSRAVFVGKSKAIALSVDHKPATDLRSIQKRGGICALNPNGEIRLANYLEAVLYGVPGGLATSRALGDMEIAEVPNARPTITMFEPKEEGYFLLACDGLFDVLKIQELHEVYTKWHSETKPEEFAEALVNLSLNFGSTDNVSVLALKYPGKCD